MQYDPHAWRTSNIRIRFLRTACRVIQTNLCVTICLGLDGIVSCKKIYSPENQAINTQAPAKSLQSPELSPRTSRRGVIFSALESLYGVMGATEVACIRNCRKPLPLLVQSTK